MAINGFLRVLALTLLFTIAISSSEQPNFSPSPSPAPQLGSDDSPLVPDSSPWPSIGSPPASPPSDLSPSPSLDVSSSPAPLPSYFSGSSPSPSPAEASDISADVKNIDETKDSSPGGMSGGKKAGVAFGVIAAAFFVGFGGILYRKRQQNIRRAQYSYAARSDFL